MLFLPNLSPGKGHLPATLYNVGNDNDTLERKRIEQEKVDRAWEMLRNMIIDGRKKE